jgi:hypothetical protein
MGSAEFHAHIFKANRRFERIDNELVGFGQLRLKLRDTRLSLKQLRRLRDGRAIQICFVTHDSVPRPVLIEPFVIGESSSRHRGAGLASVSLCENDVHTAPISEEAKKPQPLEIKAGAFHGVISAVMPARAA